MRLMAALLIFGIMAGNIHGQAPTARKVGERLGTSTGPALKKLLQQLDLPAEMVDFYSSSDIDGYRWFYLKSRTGSSLNVLALPCSSMLGAPILLLERSGGRWRVRDREGMDCHYDESASVQLASLTSGSQYDLILHHDCKARGTGYVEQHTRVLQVLDGRFKEVLDQADVIHAFPPGGPGSFEESTFVPTALNTLEETREATTYDENDQPDMGKVAISRRTFRWEGGRFVASGWTRLR